MTTTTNETTDNPKHPLTAMDESTDAICFLIVNEFPAADREFMAAACRVIKGQLDDGGRLTFHIFVTYLMRRLQGEA